MESINQSEFRRDRSSSSMEMEVGLEMEDDAFFADLTQRISLLITEDDDDGIDHRRHVVRDLYPTIQSSSYAHALNQAWSTAPVPFFYEAAAYRREITKGTGVFIPKSSLPRRKNRSGSSRHNNNGQKMKAAAAATTTSSTTVSATNDHK